MTTASLRGSFLRGNKEPSDPTNDAQGDNNTNNKKKKKREEINAWNTYETTAQQARPIRRTDATTAGLYQRRRTDKPGTQTQDVEQNQQQWNMYFEKKETTHVYSDLMQQQGETADELKCKEKNLAESVKTKIKSIFLVYFQDHHSDCFAKDLTGHGDDDDDDDMKIWNWFLGTLPWVQPWIQDNLVFPDLFLFIELCLRGIGQVFFCNNSLSGLLILIALCLQATRTAVHGVLALVSGNLAAMALGFDVSLIRSGLYGYNAVLIGLALSTFQNLEQHRGWSVSVPLVSIFFAGFSCLVFEVLGKLLVPYKAPPLTLPLDMITVAFLASTNTMPRISVGPIYEPALPSYPLYDDISSDISAKGFFQAVMRGIGQIVFCDKTAPCVLIIVAIAVCSRFLAFAAVLGSILGAAMALAVGLDTELVETGLVNFQSTLVVLAAAMFYVPSKGLFALAVVGGIAVFFLQQALETFFSTFGLVYVTFPFCLITLLLIVLQGTTKAALAVPLEAISIPEDHLERVEVLREGFGLFGALDRDQESEYKVTCSVDTELTKIFKAISNDQGSEKDGLASKDPNREMFFAMSDGKGELQVSDYIVSLRNTGLAKSEGLRFAVGVFFLLDKDGSGTIDLEEFLTICRVSKLLPPIRHRLGQFFQFVDLNNNGEISLGEIDSALECLGYNPLSQAIRDKIIRLAGLESEDAEVPVVQFMNIIAAANIRRLTEKLHQKHK